MVFDNYKNIKIIKKNILIITKYRVLYNWLFDFWKKWKIWWPKPSVKKSKEMIFSKIILTLNFTLIPMKKKVLNFNQYIWVIIEIKTMHFCPNLGCDQWVYKKIKSKISPGSDPEWLWPLCLLTRDYRYAF